jgi:hypothetical protein
VHNITDKVKQLLGNTKDPNSKMATTNSPPTLNYTTLKQRYLELKNSPFVQINPELISLIWEIMLTKKWPSHKEVQILKQRPIGRLIS